MGSLRAPNHGFPAGILHLAHMAPYGLTFVPKSFRNRHYWAPLRAPNHSFPAGILHLAHMAPYGPTFVVKTSSYDTPYSHILLWRRRPGIHEGHHIMNFHAYMQPSMLTSRVSSIHSSISLMFASLVKCNGGWVGW